MFDSHEKEKEEEPLPDQGTLEIFLSDQKDCQEGASWTQELTQKNNTGSKERTDMDHGTMKHK